ncbi:MAG: hypothetical protein BGO37_04620 [Cellulomonas sp. 73-92]|nr:MAG: hypothetical protein BGO37_04620 [Cellulomonas sp. 73-92]
MARTGAELFGTFVLVFAGLGTLLYAKLDTSGGSLTVAVAFGIAATVVLATVGRVSGGHVNPAVSLGAAIAGRLSWADLLPYWLAQLVGGALGAAVLWLTVPTGLAQLISGSEDKHLLLGTTANGFGDHSALAHLLENSASAGKAQFSLAAALLVELLATAILVGVFLVATRHEAVEQRAPFVVGLTLTVLMLVTLPITNGGLNPARSTAAAILAPSWALSQLWLFWVAPLLGAAVAALLVRAFGSSATAVNDELDDEVEDDGDEEETFPVLPA